MSEPTLYRIEYHPPCSEHEDEEHRERPGYYLCRCGASSSWHRAVPVDGPAYQRRCDSVTHDPKGETNEFGAVTEDEPEPIDNRCLDWHPELVWYEEIGGDDAG